MYEENVSILKEKTQTPLNKCKEKIIPEVSNFYLTWSFRTFVARICNTEIGDEIHEEKIKRDVIQRFIDEDLIVYVGEVSSRTRLLGIPVLILVLFILYKGWKNLEQNQE